MNFQLAYPQPTLISGLAALPMWAISRCFTSTTRPVGVLQKCTACIPISAGALATMCKAWNMASITILVL